MNENPEGTPNPLNPNPGATPTGTEPVATVEQPIVEQPIPAEQPAVTEPMSQPVAEPISQPVAEPPVSVDPSTEPVHGGSSVVVDKPKKKIGFIIAIILFIVAIAGGVAAALIVLNPFGAKKDAVPAAMAKLMSGDAPKLVVIDGTINLTSANESSPFSSMNLKFQSGSNGNSMNNYANVKVTANLKDNTEFSFNADEIGMANGTLYLKLSNIAEALNNYKPTTDVIDCAPEDEDCDEYEYTQIECDEEDEDCIETEVIMPDMTDSILEFLGVFEVIDGEWIKIPISDFSNVTDLVQVNMPTQCLIDASNKLSEYSDDIAKLYNDNQFINYTTDGLKVAQKKNTLYQLKFDVDKLTAFINSMSNSGFANELLACMGGQATNVSIPAESVAQIVNVLPEIYVEIDDQDNFTRVYLTLSTPDGNTQVTVDLSLSYPTELTINEPDVYIDINEVLNRLLPMFYGNDVYDYEE